MVPMRLKRKEFLKYKLKDFFYFSLFCGIFFLIFNSFFFKANTFYERDSALLEIPLRKHAAELLKQGNFALWTDAHGNGQPFLANPKTAIFYPTTWLYLILPFFVAFKIHYLIHPLIGWLGMSFLTRTYGLSKKSSFLASSLFFFSGIYLSSFEFYNHLAAIAWMMWALYFLRLNPPIKSPKFLLSLLAWVLLIFSGAPEFIIMTGILALVQCFIETKKFKENFLKLAITVLLACLISACQLFPALEMLSQTERTSQAEIWPLELIQLLNLVFPGILGDDRTPGHNKFWGGHLFNTWYPLYYSFYLGFGAIILSVSSLTSCKKREVKIIAMAAFIFFLISCGKYSPFFFFYRDIPLLSSIRFPVKYILGTFFCLCLTAGFSFESLISKPVSHFFSRVLFLFSFMSFLVFVSFKSSILSWFYNLFVIDDPSSKRYLEISMATGLGVLFFFSIIFLLIIQANKLKNVFIHLLLIACLIDVVFHNRNINPVVAESFFKEPAILKEIAFPATIYRDESLPFILGLEEIEKKKIISFYLKSFFPFSGMIYGARYIFNRDFMSSYPRIQAELRKMFQALSEKEKLKILNYLGCQYYIGSKPHLNPESAKKIFIESFPLYIEEISKEPARPFLVFNYVKADSLDKKLKNFLDPTFDPRFSAIIDADLKIVQEINLQKFSLNYFPEGKKPDNNSLEIIEEKSGYGKYNLILEAPGIALFPGNSAKGWKAYVDGEKAKIFPANLFSRGLFIQAGKHEVILRYFPDSFIIGSLTSLSTLLFSLAFFLFPGLLKKSPLKKLKNKKGRPQGRPSDQTNLKSGSSASGSARTHNYTSIPVHNFFVEILHTCDFIQ